MMAARLGSGGASMRRLLVIALFALSIFSINSFVSKEPAQAFWFGLDAKFPTALAACHSFQDRNGGIVLFFPIFGADQAGVGEYECVSRANGGPIPPGCDSTDIGPFPNGSLLAGCSPISPPPKGLGPCSCNGSAGDPISVNIGNLFEQVTDYE